MLIATFWKSLHVSIEVCVYQASQLLTNGFFAYRPTNKHSLRKATASLARGKSSVDITVFDSMPIGDDHMDTQIIPEMDVAAQQYFEKQDLALAEPDIPTAPQATWK